jgi:hypothetical protein
LQRIKQHQYIYQQTIADREHKKDLNRNKKQQRPPIAKP